MQRQESDAIQQLQEERNLYKSIFDSPNGNKVLEKLKSRCYYNRSTFASENNVAAFREGQRSVILHIVNLLDDKTYETIRRNVEELKQ